VLHNKTLILYSPIYLFLFLCLSLCLSPCLLACLCLSVYDQVLTRLEKQRRDWDRKLDRIRTLDLHSRNEASKEVKQKASQMGTTAALGDKVRSYVTLCSFAVLTKYRAIACCLNKTKIESYPLRDFLFCTLRAYFIGRFDFLIGQIS
jgi:hypothetical protein